MTTKKCDEIVKQREHTQTRSFAAFMSLGFIRPKYWSKDEERMKQLRCKKTITSIRD